MSANKKIITKQKTSKPADNKSVKKDKKKEPTDLLSSFDNYLLKKESFFTVLVIFCAFLFSFLLFDLKVSKGGDDAAYILRAQDLVNDFRYPSFQGPFYPFVLSIFVAIFGIKLPILKVLSLFFTIGSIYFLYKAFNKKIPASSFYFGFVLIGINSYVLYYASQTYSEALFMLLQSILFFVFFRYFVVDEDYENELKINYKRFLALGFIIFLMGITRSAGYGAFIAISIYFILQKRWKSIAYTFSGFIVFQGLFEIMKRILWNSKDIQFKAQLDQLLLIDPYYPDQGYETLKGFINRFLGNSNIYLSKYLFNFMGFREDVTDPIPILTVLAYLFFIAVFIVIFNKSKHLLFIGIYITIMYVISFLILQTRWDASRMVICYYPIVLIFFLSGFYFLFKQNRIKGFQIVLIGIFFLFFYFSIARTIEKVRDNVPILSENIKGNKFYGFTPDYENYLKMIEWAKVNIPVEDPIACRKPEIARIYGERRFVGIYRMPSENPDTLINDLKRQNVKYIILASLRKYEQVKSEYVINTLQRYLYYTQQKYPNAFLQVHQIGVDEPASMVKVVYPN